MHLLETALEPVQLRSVDGAIRAARVADGVECDEPNVARIVRVARAFGEAMAARPNVCVDELLARDRPSLRVGRYLERLAGHEDLRVIRKLRDGVLGVEMGRRADRLA